MHDPLCIFLEADDVHSRDIFQKYTHNSYGLCRRLQLSVGLGKYVQLQIKACQRNM